MCIIGIEGLDVYICYTYMCFCSVGRYGQEPCNCWARPDHYGPICFQRMCALKMMHPVWDSNWVSVLLVARWFHNHLEDRLCIAMLSRAMLHCPQCLSVARTSSYSWCTCSVDLNGYTKATRASASTAHGCTKLA